MRGVAERDPRIEYYRHAQNVGGGANIAFAMQRVATPYFSILCDDDVLLPRFCDLVIRDFAQFPSAMFVGASTLEVSETGEIVFAPAAFWDRAGLFESSEGLRRMAGGKHPTMTTVAFRRELVAAIGPIDTEAGTLLDIDYYLRVCERYPCAIDREVAGFFVRHAATWSDRAPNVDREYGHVIEKFGDPWLVATLRAQRDRRLFQLAIRALGRGDGASAASFAITLHERGARIQARIVTALTVAARFVPPLPAAIRWAYAFQLRRLGRQCLSRLRSSGDRGAADGFREELAYFKSLTASVAATQSAAPSERAKR